ncbi:hypothetical protein CPB84DRAFT_1051895 [Gymnopilus junonius]|uniref:Uncharacterized protein n=1 Tax=Gymnopilus junonius TaxID=109634 RepID=A0A9P5NPB5_GYMJU|nr:hypothetical protein CPB84DRAFT_1051895 [Gymnopilus junonius]
MALMPVRTGAWWWWSMLEWGMGWGGLWSIVVLNAEPGWSPKHKISSDFSQFGSYLSPILWFISHVSFSSHTDLPFPITTAPSSWAPLSTTGRPSFENKTTPDRFSDADSARDYPCSRDICRASKPYILISATLFMSR